MKKTIRCSFLFLLIGMVCLLVPCRAEAAQASEVSYTVRCWGVSEDGKTFYPLQSEKTGSVPAGDTFCYNTPDLDGCTPQKAVVTKKYSSKPASEETLAVPGTVSVTTSGGVTSFELEFYYTQQKSRYTFFCYDSDDVSIVLSKERGTHEFGDDYRFPLPQFEGYELKFYEVETIFNDGRETTYEKIYPTALEDGFVVCKGDEGIADVHYFMFYRQIGTAPLNYTLRVRSILDEAAYPAEGSFTELTGSQTQLCESGKLVTIPQPAEYSGYEFNRLVVTIRKTDGTEQCYVRTSEELEEAFAFVPPEAAAEVIVDLLYDRVNSVDIFWLDNADRSSWLAASETKALTEGLPLQITAKEISGYHFVACDYIFRTGGENIRIDPSGTSLVLLLKEGKAWVEVHYYYDSDAVLASTEAPEPTEEASTEASQTEAASSEITETAEASSEEAASSASEKTVEFITRPTPFATETEASTELVAGLSLRLKIAIGCAAALFLLGLGVVIGLLIGKKDE